MLTIIAFGFMLLVVVVGLWLTHKDMEHTNAEYDLHGEKGCMACWLEAHRN